MWETRFGIVGIAITFMDYSATLDFADFHSIDRSQIIYILRKGSMPN
ncbi:hypothetical protein [Enterococcus sp. S86.2]|nr:hypothetical protein [Enterococcus sp. S86.2]